MSTETKGAGSAPEVKSYDILLVGLACHINKAGRPDRLILWPDGTNPPSMVTPHYAYVVVDPEMIVDKSGWYPADESQEDLMRSGLFRLPKCRIEMSGAHTKQGIDISKHDQYLTRLDAIDRNAEIDPMDADAIAEMTISTGTFTAYRTVGRAVGNQVDAAVISRVCIPHSETITVTVYPVSGRPRKLVLVAGTEIAIANIAFPDEGTGVEHFTIYGGLTRSRTLRGRPDPIPTSVPMLEMDHQLFSLGVAITDGGAECGPTGCCTNGGPP